MIMDELNRIKIVVLGDFAVGKTSICKKYTNGIFDEKYLTTIGVEVYKKEIPEKHVQLFIWDIANDDVTNAIPTEYLKGTHAVLIVADINNRLSINNIPLHMDTILQVNENVKALIVLNKADLGDLPEDYPIVIKEIMESYKSNWISEPLKISVKCSNEDINNVFLKIIESVTNEVK
jgi:small GTP-binding protein